MEYLEYIKTNVNLQSGLISLAIVLACVAGYSILRRKIIRENSPLQELVRLRFVGLGIVLLALMAVARIWSRGAESSVHNLSLSLVYTAFAGVLIYFVSVALQSLIASRAESLEMRHKAKRAITWIGLFLFIVSALFIWGGRLGDLSVFLGIVGAGIALSLQETILCMAGWLLIIFKKPYDIGDRIEVGDQIGDVIDIGLFQTSMLEVGNWVKADQSTGRLMIVPNSSVFRNNVINYTKGFPFIWNELSIIVTYESDWQAAKEIMLEQAGDEAEKIEREVNQKITQMQREYAIQYQHFKPIVYTEIVDNGIELVLRYLSPVRHRRTTAHRISEGIINAIIPHPNVDFAYPTTRFFNNPAEGKVK